MWAPRFSWPSVLLIIASTVGATYLNIITSDSDLVMGVGFPFWYYRFSDYRSDVDDDFWSFHIVPLIADVILAIVVVLAIGMISEKILSRFRRKARL